MATTVTHPDGTRSSAPDDGRPYRWAVVREVVDQAMAAASLEARARGAEPWRRRDLLDEVARLLAGRHAAYRVIAWRVQKGAADATAWTVNSRYQWPGTQVTVVAVDGPAGEAARRA